MTSLLVERFGQKYSELNRGGIWFNVVSDNVKTLRKYESLHRFQGKYNYAILDIHKPFFIDSFPYTEVEYPIALYQVLNGLPEYEVEEMAHRFRKECNYRADVIYNEDYNECWEELTAQIEKESSHTLRKKGYDGVLFIDTLPNQPEYNPVIRQVFYVGDPLQIQWVE